jgi:hypothetical protein
MTKLFSTTVGSGGTNNITISNIPQGYSDLKLVISARTNRSSLVDAIRVSPNGVITNQTQKGLYYYGTSTVYSDTGTILGMNCPGDTNAETNTFGNGEVTILDYAGSNYKTFSFDWVVPSNRTTGIQGFHSGQWTNSAPITSLVLTPDTGTSILQNSTFTLYGIKNVCKTAGNSIKATGGNIVFDGTYVYHVFPSTGAFTTTQPITVADYVVVAGGGGGGENAGAPGGAGGYRSSVPGEMSGGGASPQARLSMPSNASYTVTVGAGGAGSSIDNGGRKRGAQGSSSSLGGPGMVTVSCTGGGYGTSGGLPSPSDGGNGGSGGSGGGGSAYGGGDTAGTGGTGTSGEGYGGGDASAGGTAFALGGGGGAGGPGSSASGSVGSYAYYAGNGGIGVYTSLARATGYGDSGYLAGGGVGGDGSNGTRGLGGGGGNGLNATASTGGGGGNGANGGSGIVIIRYRG